MLKCKATLGWLCFGAFHLDAFQTPLQSQRVSTFGVAIFWFLCITFFNVSLGQHPICFINWPMILQAQSPTSRLLKEQNFHSTNDKHKFHPQCPCLIELLAKTAATPQMHNHFKRKIALAYACKATRSWNTIKLPQEKVKPSISVQQSICYSRMASSFYLFVSHLTFSSYAPQNR